jgi:hypothetical protein
MVRPAAAGPSVASWRGRPADLSSHPCAVRGGELDGELAHAAGRARDQDVPAEQRAADPHRAQRREPGDGQGGGLGERHLVGQRRDPVRRHRDSFGPAFPLRVGDDARAGIKRFPDLSLSFDG